MNNKERLKLFYELISDLYHDAQCWAYIKQLPSSITFHKSDVNDGYFIRDNSGSFGLDAQDYWATTAEETLTKFRKILENAEHRYYMKHNVDYQTEGK